MKGHIHSRIAKLLVVLALAVVASVMFVFVGCSSECEHEKTHTETVAATCTTAGSTKTVCDDCGETIKTEPIAALGHKWDEGKVVAATCAAGGYTLKTCTVCGAQQQTDLTEALPHAWKNTTTVEPTCTTEGYTLQTCEACGATRDTNIVAAKGHKWENKEEAATCGTAGRTYQECSVCHDIRNVAVIPATGNHTWTPGTVTPATCVVDGYTEYTCSGCGATKKEVTEIAEGHKWKNLPVLREEATCTTDGYTYVECENCDERQTIDMIPATGHTYEWKVTALTCTTDGFLTGTCKDCGDKTTIKADDYAKLTGDEKKELDEKIGSAILDAEANNSPNGFLQASGHYYVSAKILADEELGGVYQDKEGKYNTPTAGDTKDDPLYLNCQSIGTIKVDGKDVDYSDYSLVCLHCNVKKDVEAHTPDVTPAHNCVAKAGTDGKIAWTCTLCGYDQPVEEHKVEMVEIATGETAPADAEYSCLYQYKCTVCDTITDAQGPHTQPGENDTYYKANCQHGELCMTCGKDIFGGKTEHKLVKMPYTATAAVNGQIAKDSTCTTKGLDVYYCEYCAGFEADEEYPFDVTWTTLSAKDAETLKLSDLTLEEDSYVETGLGNFFTAPKGEKDHAYETTYVSANPDDPDLKLCTSDFYKKDVCKDCGAVRKDNTTNADGLYGLTEGHDKHNFAIVYDKSHYLNADGTKKDGMSKFQLPNCSTNGWFLQECTNCLKTDNKTQCGTSTWVEVTLDQYIAAGQIEGVTSREEALAKPEWHAGDMPACGEPVCDVCSDRDHGVQYVLTFEAHAGEGVPAGATLPTIPAYTNYYCLEDLVVEDGVKTEKGEVAQFIAMMEKLDADDAVYSYSYYLTYKDGNFSDEITDWAEMLEPKGNVSYSKNTTIYVVVTLEDEDTVFATGYNTTARWINENVSPNRTQYLDIEICIDTDVIAIDKVEGITVSLKNAEGTAVAGAVCSTEAQLAAFVNSCKTVWYKKGSQQWIQVEEFCNKIVAEADKTANLDGVFTVWNTVEYKTCLDGYTLDITLKAGGVEFKSTVAITDTVEQIMVKNDEGKMVLQINDVPQA